MEASPTGTGLSLSTANASSPFPQLVPSPTCLRCDVCCRFPDPDSPLRPYFMDDEIETALASGMDQGAFSSRHGCQISLVPDSSGEGFLCPAFDPATACCGIYEARPLDCRLYPLALMWNDTHSEVILGWDAKCPFMGEQVPDAIRKHADHVLAILNRPAMLKKLSEHPWMIGRFQTDVVVLASLPRITSIVSARSAGHPMRRLAIEDVPRLTQALDQSGLSDSQSLAAYSLPYHYICHSLLPYWWVELNGAVCLFAQSPDGWFMPLPPLTNGSIVEALAGAFRLMEHLNGASPVSRVENISMALASLLQPHGYRLTAKDPDYLYRAAELASLRGVRFKSQRTLCNRIEQLTEVMIEPFRPGDRRECRALCEEWQAQKSSGPLEPFGHMLLEDARQAHEIIWAHAEALGVLGMVVRIEGKIRAYTFGYWLAPKTWCVLLEVADRTIPGLAQYLFRETCRQAVSQGAELINTMDDAGLAGLRSSKQAYRPLRQVHNFVCAQATCT